MKSQQWAGKISRARYVERNILRYVQKNNDPEATMSEGYDPDKDIISAVLGDAEVKADRMAHQTGHYALEFENGNGNPSGYAGTKAKHFFIVDNEHVCMMATDSLRYIVNEEKRKRKISMGETFPNGKRCQGWLVPVETILNSPYVKVISRWFPVLQENEVRFN